MTARHLIKLQCANRRPIEVPATVLLVMLIFSTASAVAQGFFAFNNWGENGSPIAPVYGPEQTDPREQRWGNTVDASPPGTQIYSGELLGGNHYVEAWFSLDPVPDAFALNEDASAVPSSLMPFFLVSPAVGLFGGGALVVPGTEQNTFGVYLQVRAWDSEGGLYLTWDEAWAAAQTGEGNSVGWSEVFWQPLGFADIPAPGLFNFESFNIFIVPEPGTVWLSVLGGVALLMVSRRLRQG